MGPMNIALVSLDRADLKLREAQGRLESASRNVRVQQRKVDDLAERLRLAQSKIKEQQTHAATFDLEIKSRDERIERLRTQQQTASNNKEYQTFLIEINTEKVDKAKTEDQMIVVMEAVETLQKEAEELSTQLEAETAKLATVKSEISERLKTLDAQVQELVPQREEAAAAVPSSAREAFDRLADRFEGEGLSALAKPDRRREEYLCSACNMSLVTDIYNKLHTRDELVYCPSCRRILYIPDDLPVEAAVNTKPKKAEKRTETETSAS